MNIKIKNFLYLAVAAVLISAPFIFFLTLTHYIDPVNACFIRIDNKANFTREALKYSRNNSKEDYKLICKNLSKVVETVCFGADWNISPGTGSDQIGCYLKGTKIAYLNRIGSTEDKARALAKFARYSKEYWEQQ